jgi:hypothetical protein
MTKSNLETDIFNYKTPEFYINMKNIPDKTSQERKSFVLEEKRKCKEGININGIHIPGGLYFHLNYYHLQGDDLKTGKKAVFLPRLRDNEWIMFNDYDKCSNNKDLYVLFGARQIAKSEVETSLCLRELSLFKETEALALFSGQPDKDTFVKKISTAITHGEKFMIVPNIDKDWSKEEIRFGFTKTDNTTELRGRLYIYNTQEGKKIQVGSGKSVSFLLMDEIAKSDFRGVYDTIEPALLSDMGSLRCAPILTFTGGETQKARDAKDIVENPKEQQFKTTLDDGNIIGGRFISGLYRKDCKEEKSISEYLGKETGTWIDNYPIHVSNFEKAFKKIDKEKEEALKSTDPNSFILKRIFFPLNLSDVFLTESNNKFPLEGIKQHQEWLKNHYEPVYAEFYRDINGKVSWRMSDKRPIHKFPVKPSDNKEAPVCIYEHPVQNAPRFTYVIGIDPLTNDESNDKIVSLFSLCVYKRMISPLDKFKNQVVASIAYRPKELKETHELALMLAEYYNALEGIYHEASESSLVQHFFLKKKAQYIADSFDLNSEISKGKFKGNSKKGSPPSTVNQRHYMDLMIEDANKEEIEINEDGDETYSLGVKFINDYMLLEEMKEYKGGSGRAVHGGNYDRIVSYGLALTLAKHYDVKYPIASQIVSKYNQNEKFKPSAIRAFGMMIETKENIFSFDPPKKSNIPSWMRGKS